MNLVNGEVYSFDISNNFINTYMEGNKRFFNSSNQPNFMKIMLNIIDEITRLIINKNKNDEISNKMKDLADKLFKTNNNIKDYKYLDIFINEDEDDRLIKIFVETLNLELGVTTKNNDENKFIIYRGAGTQFEDVIKGDKIHSISYNSSILNGILSDKTACT